VADDATQDALDAIEAQFKAAMEGDDDDKIQVALQVPVVISEGKQYYASHWFSITPETLLKTIEVLEG